MANQQNGTDGASKENLNGAKDGIEQAEVISGGEEAYWALRALGVEQVFGISSVHNVPIFEAIYRLGGIKHVTCRHEQGCVHAADAYARTTGKLGVAIVSTGPGTTNTVTGLYEAGFASSPVMVITGQASSQYYGKGKGYIHENENQLPMLRTVAPHADTVRSRAVLGETIIRVGKAILSGRPQPGAVEIPIDFQHAKAPRPELTYTPSLPPVPAEAAVAQAADLLNKAERVVIWAGGGVATAGATEELRQLAELLNAPVIATRHGRGVLPWNHPNRIGVVSDVPGFWGLLREADVILAVGARFQNTTTSEWKAPLNAVPLIQLDIDPAVIGRTYHPTVSLVGDAKEGLKALLAALTPHSTDPTFLHRAQSLKMEFESFIREEIGPDYNQILSSIQRSMPEGAVLVADTTMPANMWGYRFVPAKGPRNYVYPSSGAIGPGLPFAIGAALGSKKPVLLLQGDGGMMLSIGELSTIAEIKAPIVILVFNDRGYGAIRMLEETYFGWTGFATDLLTPDFVALAGSLGISGTTVSSPAEFNEALTEAFANNGPTLVNIDLTAMPSTSPMGWMQRQTFTEKEKIGSN